MDKRTFLKNLGLGGLSLISGSPAILHGGQGNSRTDGLQKNWMWVRKGQGRNRDDWSRMFAKARASGIDAVLPEVYNSKRALYRSSRQPNGYPWLEDLIPIARQEGLELHAWMWQMPCNQEAVWTKHPEWYAVNRNGKPSWEKPAYVDYYRFLCPSRPEVHEFLRGNVAEMASFEGVAGVHLDYIRYPDVILAKQFQKKYGIVQDKEYPEYDYCYCDVCRKEFQDLTGGDPNDLEDPPADEAWKQSRYDRITYLVNEVLVPEVRRHGKKTTAAVFPNWESVRQQWTAWKIDAVMPMLYHGFYDEDIAWIGERTAWGTEAIAGTTDLFAGLFLGHLDADTVAMAVEAARQGGASGISLFEGRSMTEEMWKSLRAALRP